MLKKIGAHCAPRKYYIVLNNARGCRSTPLAGYLFGPESNIWSEVPVVTGRLAAGIRAARGTRYLFTGCDYVLKHNGILDVLMDVVKSFGSDDVSDIRVKSQLKRIEQDAIDIFGEDKAAKGLVRDISKRAKKIIGIEELADERANKFIEMCNHVYAKMNTTYIEPLFDLFSKVYVVQK